MPRHYMPRHTFYHKAPALTVPRLRQGRAAPSPRRDGGDHKGGQPRSDRIAASAAVRGIERLDEHFNRPAAGQADVPYHVARNAELKQLWLAGP